MFGYIAADQKSFLKEEKDRYQKYYCGLCHELKTQYSHIGRASLTYDMTFLTILLSALYELEETRVCPRCIYHPGSGRSAVVTPATVYAADMNILLAYYQSLDDWNDDHNLMAREKSRQLEKYLPRVEREYPRQYRAIAESLEHLGEMEKRGELNPDLPANLFGELMGVLFLWREDEYAETLWRMGAALGRFVYLLDAVNDLKPDIKKQRYNPLTAQMDVDFTPMLTMIIAECTAEFEKLPIKQDQHILQSHLYSGVWLKYKVRNTKGTKA